MLDDNIDFAFLVNHLELQGRADESPEGGRKQVIAVSISSRRKEPAQLILAEGTLCDRAGISKQTKN